MEGIDIDEKGWTNNYNWIVLPFTDEVIKMLTLVHIIHRELRYLTRKSKLHAYVDMCLLLSFPAHAC